MPRLGIIDKRHGRLADHINRTLSSTEADRFAVGGFFPSGLPVVGRPAEAGLSADAGAV